jgi:hypothetical protein
MPRVGALLGESEIRQRKKERGRGRTRSIVYMCHCTGDLEHPFVRASSPAMGCKVFFKYSRSFIYLP